MKPCVELHFFFFFFAVSPSIISAVPPDGRAFRPEIPRRIPGIEAGVLLPALPRASLFFSTRVKTQALVNDHARPPPNQADGNMQEAASKAVQANPKKRLACCTNNLFALFPVDEVVFGFNAWPLGLREKSAHGALADRATVSFLPRKWLPSRTTAVRRCARSFLRHFWRRNGSSSRPPNLRALFTPRDGTAGVFPLKAEAPVKRRLQWPGVKEGR